MKIAILTDSFPPESEGGAAIIAQNQAVELAKRGHEVIVISTTQNRKKESLMAYEGFSVFTLYAKYHPHLRGYLSLNNRGAVKKVKTILSKFKPDIVHAHNVHQYLSYAALKLARKYARGVFLTAHDSMSFHYSKLFPETIGAENGTVMSYKVSPWKQLCLFKTAFNPFRNGIIRNYLKIPNKIFAVSGALALALKDNGIENVEVLYNGINVKKWEVDSIEKHNKKVFFGGRLSAAKGGEELVEAVRQISDAKILVVGDENDYARKMKEKAGDIVEFTGKQPHGDMKHFFNKSLVVAVPSKCFDWFPTVILEAMATRRPVVAGCFGGAQEMIKDGKMGFIINPNNPGELKAALEKILTNPDLAAKMGEEGYERVKSEFSMEKHIENLLVWYHKVLS